MSQVTLIVLDRKFSFANPRATNNHLNRLKAGMIVTVEPGIHVLSFVPHKLRMALILGIYVPPTSDFPKYFHNLGIRIEVFILLFFLIHCTWVPFLIFCHNKF